MWTTINYQNMTNVIPPESIAIQQALSDPASTGSFEVVDIGCQLNLQIGQSVIFWDENAPTEGVGTQFTVIPTIPSMNFVVTPQFDNVGAKWIGGGPNQALGAFTFLSFRMMFSNTATAGLGYTSQTTLPGYIVPGVGYCFSLHLIIPSTTLNSQWWWQVQWLDSNQNVLSTVSTFGPTTPVTGSGTVYVIASSPSDPTMVAPPGAAYAKIFVGAQPTVANNNAGTFTFSVITLEPMWFTGEHMGDGTPVTYPTLELDNGQFNCILLPDGTTSRAARIYAGTIKNLEIDYTEAGTSRTYTVHVTSLEDLIENGALINAAYTAQTDAAILNNIVSTAFAGLLSTGQGNVSLPSTTVQTGKLIDSVTYTDLTFREILNNLSDTTGFSYFVDAYGYLHYNDTPFDYALIEITDAPNYVTSYPAQDYKLEWDGTQLKNSVKVIGGTAQITVFDAFSGDGVTKVYNLTNVPVSITSITIGGTLYAPTSGNKIGTAGSTDVNGAGGVVALMDKAQQKVTFNSAPASGSNNVVLSYIIDRNVVVLVEDADSIALFGRKYMSKVNDSSLSSNASAHTRGLAEIALYAYPLAILRFNLYQYIAPGTSIHFTSSLDGLRRQPFVIQTTEITYLGGGTNLYTYEAGIYRPSLRDHLRNAHKAIARNTGVAGTTAIQLTYEIVSDTIAYSDSITAQLATPPPYRYGTARYGFASYT